METSLADMKAGFPIAPEPIQGIPTLESLIGLLFHMCRCAQTHRSPASDTMNLLFCACPRPIYGFFTADAYPDAFAPIPPPVDEVPDYTTCSDENDRATTRAKHALNRKTRADIITMNAALTDVFLDAVSLGVRAAFQQRRLREPNIVFVDMFEWFAQHYGTTTAEDRDANRQRMAADWHPGDGFDALTLRLFTGAAYANATGYPIVDRDIVDIGIRVIKRCGLYAEEYKSWIARATATPRIIETLDTFKTFWADKITLVNQTAIPASSHGYGMATVNDDDTVASYGETIANFGAAYAATQESVKTQGSTIVALQTQLQAMQQYCMGLQQQPPTTIYAPQQHARGGRGYGRRTQSTGDRGGHAPQQSTNPPTPFKRYENWNYCHTHGGDIHDTHTSQNCRYPGPHHNRTATRANMQGGSPAGLHKTILPSAAGRAPVLPQQQRAPTQAMWPQLPPPAMYPAPYPAGMTAMRPALPAAPYQQAIHHVGQIPQTMYHGGQPVGHPAPYGAIPTLLPAPTQGTMMYPSYATYQQPPPF